MQVSLWTERKGFGATFVKIQPENGVIFISLTSNSCYEHQITKERQSCLPILSAGGILADEMGLGKTLTMLVAIVLSADEAFCFNGSAPGASAIEEPLQPTKATLVITPSLGESCNILRWGDRDD
jgi:SNF2-related domain